VRLSAVALGSFVNEQRAWATVAITCAAISLGCLAAVDPAALIASVGIGVLVVVVLDVAHSSRERLRETLEHAELAGGDTAYELESSWITIRRNIRRAALLYVPAMAALVTAAATLGGAAGYGVGLVASIYLAGGIGTLFEAHAANVWQTARHVTLVRDGRRWVVPEHTAAGWRQFRLRSSRPAKRPEAKLFIWPDGDGVNAVGRKGPHLPGSG